MNNPAIPAAVQDLFSSSDVQDPTIASPNTPTGTPYAPHLASEVSQLPPELRFAIESRLNALNLILADIDRRRPELWKATDLACQCLDEVQILLNSA